MKKGQIVIYNSKELVKKIEISRNSAITLNMNSDYAKDCIAKLVSPDSKTGYLLSENGTSLISSGGKSVPIINGIPDFTVFSHAAMDDKMEQASYHDNEEVNERFDEIILRPFNYNLFHAKIWIEHLYRLAGMIEKNAGVSLEGLTILNCACGGGFEAQFFAGQGAKIIGFDISQLRAEGSATRFALNNLDGFFYRGDASILPFDDNSFDIVLYHDSLHHIPIEDIPKAIKEASRVTSKFVVLNEPNNSAFRMLMENMGLSISIEASGNYVFRLTKSLMTFWCKRFGMKLLVYDTRFVRMEHRPQFFASGLIGKIGYYIMKFFAHFLKPVGNEAMIIMEKDGN